jgi:tetratricopeptide (TPR) repeat protein
VILFELLSGSLPHDIGGSSFFEAARMIREEPPRSLLMLAPGTPSDLRTIVAKSLAKECSQRYQSAAELAADLRRYLSSEPILARSPSLFYQATRFTQRHRALVSVGASGLVALVGGLITTTIAYRRAQENQVLAEAAAEVSRREAAKANAIAAFFSEMLEGVGPMVAAGRDTQLLREILDSTSEQLPTRLKGDPQVQGILRRTISGVYRDLGEMQTAHSMAEESLRLLEGSMPPDSIEVATAVCTLASCATDITRPEEAVTLAERARAIFASADAKGIAGGRRGVALCDMVIGDAHRVSGKPAEAAERYLAALPLLESAPDSPPLDKADAASGASLAYLDLGNGAKALEYAQRARDGLAAVYGERSIRVAYMDDQLGSAYYMLADPKASVRAHRAAVEVAGKVAARAGRVGEKDVPAVVKDAPEVVKEGPGVAKVSLAVAKVGLAVVRAGLAEVLRVVVAGIPEEAELADEDHRFQTPSEPGHGPAPRAHCGDGPLGDCGRTL